MRRSTTFLILLAISAVQALHAQWSQVKQITSGPYDDKNVTFVFSRENYQLSPNDEWAAFSRGNSEGGRSICVIRTVAGGGSWIDSVAVVSADTSQNDFCCFAHSGLSRSTP